MKRALWIGILLLGAAAGCKEGKDDRCQINSDCANGLVCAAATNTCESSTGTGIDAEVPDGMVKLDAPLDSLLAVDAAPPDAGSGSGSGI